MKSFNLSAWGLHHPTLVVFMMISSLILGIVAYSKLGRSEDPQLAIEVMLINVAWPGASVKDIELQVIEKIQQTLQEVPHFDYVQSYIKPGHAAMFLMLKDGTRPAQINDSWYQVRKRVNDMRHTLPTGVIGPFFNDDFDDTFGSIYAFHADGFDDSEIKKVLLSARERILETVPDVAKVILLGVQEPKFYVEFSYARLAKLGITPFQLIQGLQQQNSVIPSGIIEGANERIFMRLDGAFTSSKDIENSAISANGHSFRLGDIATVTRGFTDPPHMSMHRNGNRVTALAISMAENGDILKLGAHLETTMQQIQKTLPAGITIEKIVDQPTLVKDSINEFLGHFLLALAIVLMVSLLTLGLRSGTVVALSVPLVLGMTFFIMWCCDIHLHRVSLGALIIALGLLVDDAIIAIEMMQLKLEEGWDRLKAASFAWTSTAFPMLTGTLITAAGFVPVGFALSTTSEFTGAIFSVVTISLLVSWLVAVLFTPYLGSHLLTEQSLSRRHSVIQQRFQGWLALKIQWCVLYKKQVLLATMAAFILSIGAFQLVSYQFFPDSPREEILIDLYLAEGASYAGTLRATQKVEQLLQQEQRVRSFTTYIGTGSPRFYLVLQPEIPKLNYAQLIVYPHKLKEAKQLTQDLRASIAQLLPDARTRLYRLELGPPVGYAIQFRVRGADPDTVRTIAAQLRDSMRTNPYLRDVHLQWSERTKAIRFMINQDRARAIGVNNETIATTLQALLSGYIVTHVRDGSESIDVIIRAKPEERLDARQLGNLTVPSNNGRNIALNQIATIEPELEEGGLWTRNRLPMLSVRADVQGAQPATVVKQLEPLLQDIRKELPLGYSIETGGVVEESTKADHAIFAMVPITFLLWMTFLIIQLHSFSRMFMVLLTAPLGMIGVSLALLLTGSPFGFTATLGLIGLAGMIMRNSVILIDQIDTDIASGETPWNAIIGATIRRTRPVVLTALAAILAMIPLTLSDLWQPMAVSIMGGLTIATVLTLFFLPALYATWFKINAPDQH